MEKEGQISSAVQPSVGVRVSYLGGVEAARG
eukprot:CAMPEP_0170637854 /NCGR_PEP_ID=MMETSP0224-20130122/38671_1 /TAXON_ID=285029 /ORGANISM="Togula jolla, Strain CCCM 725" /LENGTH=30 /DNA_ID= /DNA_START= /DNA_END= /DNA_ORIENTATION=